MFGLQKDRRDRKAMAVIYKQTVFVICVTIDSGSHKRLGWIFKKTWGKFYAYILYTTVDMELITAIYFDRR